MFIFVFSSIGSLIAFSQSDGNDLYKSFIIDEEKTYSTDETNHIIIKSTSGDVNFILVDSEEITVKYYGKVNCLICNTNQKLTASKTSDTIEFKTTSRTYGIQFFSDLKMDVYLPKNYENNLTISTVSSDVSIEKLTLVNLDMTTVSGDIQANELILTEAKFTTVSGDIELTDIEVTNKTYLNTTSGEISLDSILSNIQFRTISGDIESNNHNGNIIGSTVSGDVDLHEVNNSFNVDITTVSGDVDVDVNQEATFNFNTSTVSGNINIRFEYTVTGANSSRSVIGRVGENSNNIHINTTSGDILIK